MNEQPGGLDALWLVGLVLVAISAVWLVPFVLTARRTATSWWRAWRAEDIRSAVLIVMSAAAALAGIGYLVVGVHAQLTGG